MDKREFQKSLEAYYREKGKHPPPQTPVLAGKPISLHLLFERVTKLGGSYILSNEDRWQDILQAFNLQPPSASLAYGLRKIYRDYLESFEKLQLYGEEPEFEEEEKKFHPLDEISERRKPLEDTEFSRSIKRSNRDRSQYTHEHYRSMYRPEPPEWRLINSLRSCLPNEVNFIINTLLLYCSDHHKGKRLKLERCPHLLDILMLHAGCPKLEDLKLYEKWKTNSNLLLMEYWEHKLGDCDQIKPLLGLEKNLTIKSDEFINGESDREGQRIRHILVIIRNICQDQRDIHFIRRSELVLKFLLRCSFIKNDIGLVEQALETISLLVQGDKTDKSMEPPVWSYDPYISILVDLICKLISQSDKMIQIRTLEIYTSLLEQTIIEENVLLDEPPKRSDLAQYLDNIIPDFSEQLIPLLTLPDCEVVIATLEALNALAKSPMGVSLLKNESISLLVDLLSFSSRNYDISGSRFYGPRLQEITHQPLVVVPRIARRVMPAGAPSGQHAAGTPHRVAVHPGQHIGQGTPQMPNRPIQSQSSSTPSSQAISTQSKSLPQKRMNQTTTVPPQTVQEDQNATQVHAIQFCKKFLQARIELTEDTAMVPRNGIFLEYQAMAKQDGQKNGVSGIPILGIPDFTRLIREMFPTSQLINDAQSRQVFSGIKIKPKEAVVTNGPLAKPKPNGNISNGNGISSKECSPQKINGKANGVRNESNGISNDEDSNHSQQSLDSVGGTKPPHLANTVKDEPKEILKKPEVKENGLNGNSNGCIDGITKDTSNEKTTEDNMKTDKMNTESELPLTKKEPQSPVKTSADEPKSQQQVNGQIPVETPRKRPLNTNNPNPNVAPGPSAGLRVLLQNAGSFLFDDFTDDREDCLTRSIRIQSALVLLSLVEQSKVPNLSNDNSEPVEKKPNLTDIGGTSNMLILELLKRYEQRISLIAASRQDASPVLARLLSFMP